jgi:hypothetical protein
MIRVPLTSTGDRRRERWLPSTTKAPCDDPNTHPQDNLSPFEVTRDVYIALHWPRSKAGQESPER